MTGVQTCALPIYLRFEADLPGLERGIRCVTAARFHLSADSACSDRCLTHQAHNANLSGHEFSRIPQGNATLTVSDAYYADILSKRPVARTSASLKRADKEEDQNSAA